MGSARRQENYAADSPAFSVTLEMDAGQGGDFGFYILLAQQVQDMVINALIVAEIWLRKNQALCFSISASCSRKIRSRTAAVAWRKNLRGNRKIIKAA